MLCKDCGRGVKKTIPGNGISEPPYVSAIRCPFDDKYYHDPDAECNFKEQLKSMTSMLDFTNLQGRWFDEDTFVMEWDGGRDDEGDEFLYMAEWQVDHGVLVFSKTYDHDTVFLHISAEEKAKIIQKMMELVLREGEKKNA